MPTSAWACFADKLHVHEDVDMAHDAQLAPSDQLAIRFRPPFLEGVAP
ncbi:MAG: hypothetical protein JNM18_26845 [Planctomycetaceae bacterium]|nr:hypothetical protein [Planctomycetaceae bacterium]